MSTLATWSHVVQSRDVSPHNFDGLTMSGLAFSVAPPNIGKQIPPYPQLNRLVLNSPTPEKWKAELTLMWVIYRADLPDRSHQYW